MWISFKLDKIKYHHLYVVGIDVFQVIIHEIGHSVGLLHSDVPDSVMTPFYRSPQRNQFKFSYDDIEGIQRLYGKIIVTFVHNLPIYKDNSTLFMTYIVSAEENSLF